MKLHYSIPLLFSCLLLNGCAHGPDSIEALTAWDNKYQQCAEEEKNSDFIFPQTNWFLSLSPETQKNVVLYLFQLKEYQCTGHEAKQLRKSLAEDNHQSLISLFSGLNLFMQPDTSLIEGIDRSELEKLEKQVPMFNLRKVALQLGF